VIEMVRDGVLPRQGFLKQENISFDAFLATTTGQLYATGG
jgi:saccharopine dehydrogenase (NAD+, L-lysine-forming)